MHVLESSWVLPVQPWQVMADGAVAVDGGRIIAVAGRDELARRYPDAPRVRLPQHALMPGLVNAHTHAAMTLLRGFADDVPLMTWLRGRIWPTEGRWVDPGFVADGTRLAVAEMLRSGVTCFSDMYFFPAETIEVCRRMGIRVVSGQVVVDGSTNYAADGEDHLRKAREVIERFRGTELVAFTLAPHSPYTVSDALFGQVLDMCEEFDVRLHTHLHETRDEIAQGVEQYGVRPVGRLDRLGVIGERLVAAHAVHLTDDEIALFAERGAAIAHCPVSNLKLASGIARLAEVLRAGITVGIGTDGVASNNRLDVLGDTRLASLLAKGVSEDAAAAPAAQALRCATLGGAAAVGLAGEIGSLTPGKSADIIALNLGGADLAPMYDVASHLINCADRRAVSDVWVAGERRVENGTLVDVDDDELVALARAWQERITG